MIILPAATFLLITVFSLFHLLVLTPKIPLGISRSSAWWAAAALVDRGLWRLFGGTVVSLRGPVVSPVDRGNYGLASPPLPFSLLGGAGVIPGVWPLFSLSFPQFLLQHAPPTLWGALDTAFR